MIWKKAPHLPEVGEKIYGILKDEKTKRFMAHTMEENDTLSIFEKWCTQEEMKDFMNQKLRDIKNG